MHEEERPTTGSGDSTVEDPSAAEEPTGAVVETDVELPDDGGPVERFLTLDWVVLPAIGLVAVAGGALVALPLMAATGVGRLAPLFAFLLVGIGLFFGLLVAVSRWFDGRSGDG